MKMNQLPRDLVIYIASLLRTTDRLNIRLSCKAFSIVLPFDKDKYQWMEQILTYHNDSWMDNFFSQYIPWGGMINWDIKYSNEAMNKKLHHFVQYLLVNNAPFDPSILSIYTVRINNSSLNMRMRCAHLYNMSRVNELTMDEIILSQMFITPNALIQMFIYSIAYKDEQKIKILIPIIASLDVRYNTIDIIVKPVDMTYFLSMINDLCNRINYRPIIIDDKTIRLLTYNIKSNDEIIDDLEIFKKAYDGKNVITYNIHTPMCNNYIYNSSRKFVNYLQM